jgi:hypothetical protein
MMMILRNQYEPATCYKFNCRTYDTEEIPGNLPIESFEGKLYGTRYHKPEDRSR